MACANTVDEATALLTKLSFNEQEALPASDEATYPMAYYMAEDWQRALRVELKAPYYKQLEEFIEKERKRVTIFPRNDQVFSFTHYCSIEEVKVVIVGQDPATNDKACGIAFSCHGRVLHPSLKNIYKALEYEVGGKSPDHGHLGGWCRQGVLLLNTALTVEDKKAGSHIKTQWKQFTHAIISHVNANLHPVVFMLWGEEATKIYNNYQLIDHDHNLVLEAPHPSPKNTKDQEVFHTSNHFSECNKFLVAKEMTPIDWNRLPEECGSEPTLLEMQQKHLKKQKEVKLPSPPKALRVIKHQLWCCCGPAGIVIYNSDLYKQRTILFKIMGDVNDVAELSNGEIVIAANKGLFQCISTGRCVRIIIRSKLFTSVAIYLDHIYAADHNSEIIHWVGNKATLNNLKVSKSDNDFITLCMSNSLLIDCSMAENIVRVRTVVKNRMDATCSAKCKQKLSNPFICNSDDNGYTLIADSDNDKLQVMTEKGDISSLQLHPPVSTPRSAAVFNKQLYVTSLGDQTISLWKEYCGPEPTLLEVSQRQKKEQRLPSHPEALRIINQQLWCCCPGNGIVIYNSDLQKQCTKKNTDMDHVYDVAELSNGDIVLAAKTGLYCVTAIESKKTLIDDSESFYSVVSYRDEVIAALQMSNIIRVYWQTSNKWNMLKLFDLLCGKKDYITLSLNNNQLKCCSRELNRIFVYSLADMKFLYEYGTPMNGEACQLSRPYICTDDNDGSILIADSGNDRLQVMTVGGNFTPIPLPSLLSQPRSAAVFKKHLFVTSYKDETDKHGKNKPVPTITRLY